MSLHASALAARIAAQNRANAECNRLQPIFAAAFAPLVGSKILNATGCLSAKAEKLRPQTANTPDLSVWLSRVNYELAFEVRCSDRTEKGSNYYGSNCFRVGEIEKGILVKLSPPCAYPADFTVAGIMAARVKLDEAQEALHDAQRALYTFGRYDQ